MKWIFFFYMKALYRWFCSYWSRETHQTSNNSSANLTKCISQVSEPSHSNHSELYEATYRKHTQMNFEANTNDTHMNCEALEPIHEDKQENEPHRATKSLKNQRKQRSPKQIEAYKKNFAKRWQHKRNSKATRPKTKQTIYDEIF